MKNKQALISYWDNFNTELYYKYLKVPPTAKPQPLAQRSKVLHAPSYQAD